MVRGAFNSFRHEHCFYAIQNQTVMKDIFCFESPGGWLGEWFNFLVLGGYMRRLLEKKNKVIKEAAESSIKYI